MSENKDQEDIANFEQVPDYRFARLTKGQNYAYARGLLINPAHLPLALDAMLADGWRVMAVFGQTDTTRVGFLFERVAVADAQVTDAALDKFMSALANAQADLMKAEWRIIELLNANNKMVETAREQRERLRRFELLYGVLGE